MSFTTIRLKLRRNSVPRLHRSFPLIIPTFIESAMFLLGDESDMRWHTMFIIKLPYVIGTLHPIFSYKDTISQISNSVRGEK
jgi:hypothetical protein